VTKRALETRNLGIALAGYIILLAIQLAGYFTTHMVILLATIFEVVSSMLVVIFLLYAAMHSYKSADKVHMFGYGRTQNIASLAVSIIFITFMSIEVFRQSIPKFFQTPDAGLYQNSGMAFIIIIVSICIPIIVISFILKVKSRSATLKTQLISSFEDLFSYFAGLIGIVLVDRGFTLADPICSVIVGIIILVFGILLFKENANYLLGKAPNIKFIGEVETKALSVKGVLGVSNLTGEYVGSGVVHAGFDIEIARGTSIEEADKIAHEVQEKIAEETGCKYCTIHVHPSGKENS
jgi:cation diffusion facilitator family transporter